MMLKYLAIFDSSLPKFCGESAHKECESFWKLLYRGSRTVAFLQLLLINSSIENYQKILFSARKFKFLDGQNYENLYFGIKTASSHQNARENSSFLMVEISTI